MCHNIDAACDKAAQKDGQDGKPHFGEAVCEEADGDKKEKK